MRELLRRPGSGEGDTPFVQGRNTKSNQKTRSRKRHYRHDNNALRRITNIEAFTFVSTPHVMGVNPGLGVMTLRFETERK